MITKYKKVIVPENGAMPYSLVEFTYNGETKIIRVDSKRVWEIHKEEMIEYAKKHWNKLDRFIETENEE